MQAFKIILLTIVMGFKLTGFSQNDIHCQHSGDWDDNSIWDINRTPHHGDRVHVDNWNVSKNVINHLECDELHTKNSTIVLNDTTTINGILEVEENSTLIINAPLSCTHLHIEENSKICLNAPLTVCYIDLEDNAILYANGQNITITNCTNVSNPISRDWNSHIFLDRGCDGSYKTPGTLSINGNVIITECNLTYNNITISNGTLNWGSCNVTILGTVTLNPGGNFTTTGTVTYGQNAQLVFNRSYTLTRTQKVWAMGTGNSVPPSVTINSGVISTNDTFTVKRRLNLIGGTVGSSASGTKLKLITNDTLFKCGGQFYSTPWWGSNVLTLYCDVQPGNPPAILGTEMPATGFTGDVIISTNLILGGNISAPTGKVIVTSTGILNDSNFTVNQATQVQVQSGGTIVTTKSGGLTGTNSLLGNLPTSLSPTSTVIYTGNSGTQIVSQGTTYGNLILSSASLKTFAPGITTIAGNFTVSVGSGMVTVNPGSTINFTGNNQQVSGLNYHNVNFAGTGTTNITSSASVAANMNMNVNSGVVVNTNNNLTLLSGPTGSAQIGPLLNGAQITGNVCWLRYIPGGPSNRRWRFLSNPVKNVTFRWWQNDIFITGPGSNGVACATNTTSTSSMVQNSNGFDQNQSLLVNPANTSAMTCFTWKETTASWQTIPRTTDTINPLVAYRTFVRGDRNIEGCLLMTAMPDSVSPVTLHSCGPVVQGPQTVGFTKTNGTGNGWNYVSNPYPCSVNWWDPSWVASRSASIQPTLYIWVPERNQYATWNPFSGGINGGSNIIGTGQSFFVQTTANTQLTFQESYKLDSGQIGFFGKTSTNLYNNLKVSLKGTVSKSNDQAIIYILKGTTSDFENPYDALKMGYTSGSISSSTKLNPTKLAINAIAPIQNIDTILLSTFISTTGDTYTLNFDGADNFDVQYVILLRDKFLNTLTNISSSKSYTFNTTNTNSGSYSQSRFEVIIMNSTSLPITLSQFTATKEKSKTVLVSWTTATEINNSHFIVEHSTDGSAFTQLSVVKGFGNSSVTKNYSYLHQNPMDGINYYRLTQVDGNNNKTESHVVILNIAEQTTGVVTLFPVPVSNTLNVNFGNTQVIGNAIVKIFDITGRELIHNEISLNYNQETYSFDVSNLTKGSYFVNVVSNGREHVLKFIKD